MAKKVSVEQFTSEITHILRTYSDAAMEEVNDVVRDVANESRDELKVAGSFNNRTGKYRKGWSVTFREKRLGIEATVHNKLYQLTHLLESGHAKFLWGRATGETVRAFPHIEKVNEEAQRKLEEEVKRRIGDL